MQVNRIDKLKQEIAEKQKELDVLLQEDFEKSIQFRSRKDILEKFPNAEFFEDSEVPIGQIVKKSLCGIDTFYEVKGRYIPSYKQPWNINWWICEEIKDVNNLNLKLRNRYGTCIWSEDSNLEPLKFLEYPPNLERLK